MKGRPTPATELCPWECRQNGGYIRAPVPSETVWWTEGMPLSVERREAWTPCPHCVTSSPFVVMTLDETA